jgi:hypothetical protein
MDVLRVKKTPKDSDKPSEESQKNLVEKPEEDQHEYLLNLLYMDNPIPVPVGTKLTKILVPNGKYVSLMKVDFESTGYQCPTDRIRVYYLNHPTNKDLCMEWTVSLPSLRLEDVLVMLKKAIL